MRIGLYGGSFDPIHPGHVEPVREAAETLGLERVLYLPTGRPPHKPGRRLAPAWARFAMAELALLEEADFRVSTHELREDRPSYTFETVEHFRRLYPADEIVLLLGSDSFRQLGEWREPGRILAAAEVGVLERPGSELAAEALSPPLAEALREGRARWVRNRPVPVSSSEIRRLLAAGEGVPPHMLHHLVLDYIGKYELYTRDP